MRIFVLSFNFLVAVNSRSLNEKLFDKFFKWRPIQNFHKNVPHKRCTRRALRGKFKKKKRKTTTQFWYYTDWKKKDTYASTFGRRRKFFSGSLNHLLISSSLTSWMITVNVVNNQH